MTPCPPTIRRLAKGLPDGKKQWVYQSRDRRAYRVGLERREKFGQF
jgi:hypothetical protein